MPWNGCSNGTNKICLPSERSSVSSTEKLFSSTTEPPLQLGGFVDIEVEREKPREGLIGVVGPDQMLSTEEEEGGDGENRGDQRDTMEPKVEKASEQKDEDEQKETTQRSDLVQEKKQPMTEDDQKDRTEEGPEGEWEQSDWDGQWNAETAHFRQFSGTTAMVVPSDKSLRMDKLDLELEIRPQSPNGVIFFASGGTDHRRPGKHPFMHSLELENGIVKYKFSLGEQRFETLQSRAKVPLNGRTVIRLLNDGRGKATLQVGSSDQPVHLFYGTDHPFAYPPNALSRVFIGGVDPMRAKHFPKMINFIGSIGHLKINGKSVQINGGEGAEKLNGQRIEGTERGEEQLQEEATLDQSENQCANEPCRNGGRCQLTRWGFECHCRAGYAGHLCQLPSTDGVCPGGQRLCAHGVCTFANDDPSDVKCLCQPGQEGKRCESKSADEQPSQEEEGTAQRQMKGIRFDGKQSFLALPLGFGVEEGKQNAPRPYSIELRLSLDAGKAKQQMIGSMVGEKGQLINAIGVEEDKLWIIHREDDQMPFTRRFLTKRVKDKKTHHLLRIEPSDVPNAMSVLLDGRPKGMLKGEPGTDGILLLGALPPRGVIVPDAMHSVLEGIVPFEGCVEELLLNGRVLGMAELQRDQYTGGSLQSCGETEGWTTTLQTTTTPFPEEPSPPVTTTVSMLPPSTTPINILSASEDSNLGAQSVREGFLVDVIGTTEAYPNQITTTESVSSREFFDFETTTSVLLTTVSPPTPDPTTMVPIPRRTFPKLVSPIAPEATIPSAFVPHAADSVEVEGPFSGLCDEDGDTCGAHGECEEVNGTHVMCECRDYYVGQRCDEFRPIEYAAKFDGSAFVVFSSDDFPHLSSEQEEVVEFKVRTSVKYGLVVWQGQLPSSAEVQTDDEFAGEDYLSIGLLDGHLSFSFELGGGAAQILSESPLDDGKTHSIRAIRRGRDGWLFVDDEPPTTGRSSGILAMLNVEGHVFVGGVPDLHDMTFGLHTQNFVGCLAELKLNGQKMDMMGNAIDGRNLRPCRSWQPAQMRRRRKWMRRVRNQRKTAQRRAAVGGG